MVETSELSLWGVAVEVAATVNLREPLLGFVILREEYVRTWAWLLFGVRRRGKRLAGSRVKGFGLGFRKARPTKVAARSAAIGIAIDGQRDAAEQNEVFGQEVEVLDFWEKIMGFSSSAYRTRK